jgi:hypothetical protein
MKAREPKPDIKTALTVQQFCRMFCLSPELYAALKRTGLGPREVRFFQKGKSCKGDRILIPLEYVAQWRIHAEPLRVFAERIVSKRPTSAVVDRCSH